MPVEAQDVEFSLFGGMDLHKLKMGKDTSSHWTIEQFKLDYDFASLFGNRPHVKHLHVKGAKAKLIFDNRWNLQGRRHVMSLSDFDSELAQPSRIEKPKIIPDFRVDEFKLEDIDLEISRINNNWKKLNYKFFIEELALKNFSSKGEINLVSTGKLDLAIDDNFRLEIGAYSIELSGKLSLQSKESDLKLKIILDDLSSRKKNDPFKGRKIVFESSLSYQEKKLNISKARCENVRSVSNGNMSME